jgi:hypothetical protein
LEFKIDYVFWVLSVLIIPLWRWFYKELQERYRVYNNKLEVLEKRCNSCPIKNSDFATKLDIINILDSKFKEFELKLIKDGQISLSSRSYHSKKKQ